MSKHHEAESVQPEEGPKSEDTQESGLPTPLDPTDEFAAEDKSDDTPVVPSNRKNPFKRALPWARTHKKKSIPLGVVLLIGLLAAIPATRYAIAGSVIKQNFAVTVLDSQTKKPVSSATVKIDGVWATTNNEGRVTLHVASGPAKVSVSKKYYKTTDSSLLVPLTKQKSAAQITIVATGRPVPMTILNKISGKPVANATVKVAGTEAKTDETGQITFVLPPEKPSLDAVITASGYNNASVKVQVTLDAKANNFQLTPAGKLYFLSNLSGKLDVVKTDLDGQNRETVVAGSGYENKQDTVLLASRDWKFAALKSVRDNSGKAKLQLLDLSSGKLATIDEGSATFSPIGWYNHYFMYSVYREGVANWQPNREALKSFNADSSLLVTLDQTSASGNNDYDWSTQTFGGYYIQPDKIVYYTYWNTYYYAPASTKDGKFATIRAVQPDGKNKKDYKTFDATVSSLNSSLYEPGSVYFRSYSDGKPTDYEFEDGAVKPLAEIKNEAFDQAYPTYLISPSGSQTFWSEIRDGKNSLFVGDKDAKNSKQLASLSDYKAYGWYSDDYLLVSKNGSELYVLPSDGGTPLKVTDYYKPAASFNGYGYGYGGL